MLVQLEKLEQIIHFAFSDLSPIPFEQMVKKYAADRKVSIIRKIIIIIKQITEYFRKPK